jgi:hypothetical protein
MFLSGVESVFPYQLGRMGVSTQVEMKGLRTLGSPWGMFVEYLKGEILRLFTIVFVLAWTGKPTAERIGEKPEGTLSGAQTISNTGTVYVEQVFYLSPCSHGNGSTSPSC